MRDFESRLRELKTFGPEYEAFLDELNSCITTFVSQHQDMLQFVKSSIILSVYDRYDGTKEEPFAPSMRVVIGPLDSVASNIIQFSRQLPGAVVDEISRRVTQ